MRYLSHQRPLEHVNLWLLATVLIHLHLPREKMKINNNCEFKIIFLCNSELFGIAHN